MFYHIQCTIARNPFFIKPDEMIKRDFADGGFHKLMSGFLGQLECHIQENILR